MPAYIEEYASNLRDFIREKLKVTVDDSGEAPDTETRRLRQLFGADVIPDDLLEILNVSLTGMEAKVPPDRSLVQGLVSIGAEGR